MSAKSETQAAGSSGVSAQQTTIMERKSERELVIKRSFAAPAHLVFQAWAKPELFRQWWTPKSYGMTILSCEMDVRTGGGYRLEIGHPAFDQPMVFFGSYTDVVPNQRIVWTNEESADGAITTVTFTETDGRTEVSVSNLFPSVQALEDELASGATECMGETFNQLEELLGDNAGG